MKITICSSIYFAADILRIRDELSKMGHEVFIPQSMIDHDITDSHGATELKTVDRKKYIGEIKPHYTMNHFKLIERSDAILVVNLNKNGIENYIGGATFSEIMVAYYLRKKIFFMNPIPTSKNYEFLADELETANPIIVNGNLSKVK